MDLTKYGFREGFDFDNRFHLKTKVGKYTISTVDLGLNYQFDDNLPPLYYETMIFNREDTEENPFEDYLIRYTTEEEARAGHEIAIEYVKSELEEELWNKNY